VALWRGREGLRHGLRVASTIVLVSVAVAPFVIWIFRDLNTASQFAQVISVPIGLFSLGGTVATSRRADPPAESAAERLAPDTETPETKPPESPPLPLYLTERKPPKPSSSRWQSIFIRTASVVLLVAALVAGTLLIIPDNDSPAPSDGTYKDKHGQLAQNLVHTGGPKPVLFNGGATWKWLEVARFPEGTVVTFSPGGGPLNDGLGGLRGYMRSTGNCSSEESFVYSTFKADGHFVGNGYSGDLDIALPDHVDVLELTMQAVYDPHENCTLGLQWSDPRIERSRPLPKPSPSPSPS
jgi:hypothetical protein